MSQVGTSALLEGEERAKELAACEQLIRAQISHIRAKASQPNGPSATQEKVVLTKSAVESEPNPLYRPSRKAMRKAKAMEKAALREVVKKESPEAAQKREAV